MSLSTCEHCGGHIPLGPDASNCCEVCGKFVFTPCDSNGFSPDELRRLKVSLQQIRDGKVKTFEEVKSLLFG